MGRASGPLNVMGIPDCSQCFVAEIFHLCFLDEDHVRVVLVNEPSKGASFDLCSKTSYIPG